MRRPEDRVRYSPDRGWGLVSQLRAMAAPYHMPGMYRRAFSCLSVDALRGPQEPLYGPQGPHGTVARRMCVQAPGRARRGLSAPPSSLSLVGTLAQILPPLRGPAQPEVRGQAEIQLELGPGHGHVRQPEFGRAEVTLLGGHEVRADLDRIPLVALALVSRRDHDAVPRGSLGGPLVLVAVEGLDDGLSPELLHQFHIEFQISTLLLLLHVADHVGPGGEHGKLSVLRGLPTLEPLSSLAKAHDLGGATHEVDPATGGDGTHQGTHRASVGPAQDGVGVSHRANRRGHLAEALDPEAGTQAVQEAVGLLSHRVPEPERLAQEGDLGTHGLKVSHGVDGPAPFVQHLLLITDTDHLDPTGTVELDHLSLDRIGVLGLIEEDEVDIDDRLGQAPSLEIAVVSDPEATSDIGHVGPSLAGEGEQVLSHPAVVDREGLAGGLINGIDAVDEGAVADLDLTSGRVAEPVDHAQALAGEPASGQCAALLLAEAGDVERADAQDGSHLVGGLTGHLGGQAVSEVLATGGEGDGVHGVAGHVARHVTAHLLDDLGVVGQILAPATVGLGVVGEELERAGLASTGPGLEDEVFPGGEDLDGVGLLIGGRVGDLRTSRGHLGLRGVLGADLVSGEPFAVTALGEALTYVDAPTTLGAVSGVFVGERACHVSTLPAHRRVRADSCVF